ncbi:MAG: cupin domain-containing protein [candidate division WOR-3 bacterium]
MEYGYYANVTEHPPSMPGSQATIRWLISEQNGARNFAMRVIALKSKGDKIPPHSHAYEHEIFLISGTGRVMTPDLSVDLTSGDFAFIRPGEEHSFENLTDEPLQFICVIPIPGSA